MCLISIVMSSYNDGKYLRESIESILNQTFSEFEFIIINDGSSDNSLRIINEYMEKDDRIVLVNRKNRGLNISLNEGILLSRGKYIARMDADDISELNRLEEQFKFLEENKEVQILGTYANMFGDCNEKTKEKFIKLFNTSIDHSNVDKMFVTKCYLAHPSVMMRKEMLFNLNLYDKKMRIAEDYDLWLRAIKKGYKISKINKKLINIRVHSESITQTGIRDSSIFKYIGHAKLNFVKENLKTKMNYVIWGAGKGGRIARQVIQQYDNSFKCIGYIDKFKEGFLDGIKIHSHNEIKNLKYDYLFIATVPGLDEAEEYAKKIGLNKIEDYIYIL